MLEFSNKPTYPQLFDLVAGLPNEIKPSTIHLILWVWRHTNSDRFHANFGKAWVSHPNIAREMHMGKTAIQAAFNDACAWGVLSREHLFKKNGRVVLSSAPYRRKESKGLGEYLGSRYWLNYEFMKELHVGPLKLDTPVDTPDTSDSSIGVAESAVSLEIGVPENDTPTSESDTKVLKEGFDFPDRHRAASVPLGEPSERGADQVAAAARLCSAGVLVNEGVSDSLALTPSADATGRAPSSGEKGNRADKGSQNLSEIEVVSRFEVVFETVVKVAGLSAQEIERWNRQRGRPGVSEIRVEDDRLKMTAKHRQEAVALYRAWGGEKVLRLWENFLVTVDHSVDTNEDSPQRSWLLKDFVEWAYKKASRVKYLADSGMAQEKAEAVVLQASAADFDFGR
jgi:hypothetical protein